MNSGKNAVWPQAKTLALLMPGLLLAGCNSSSSESEDLATAVEVAVQTEKGTLIESFTISESEIILKEDEQYQLSAEGTDQNGDNRDVTRELTWTSSNKDIAKVSSKGQVTGVSYSTEPVTITATTNTGIAAEVEVLVQDLTVKSVAIRQESPQSGNVLTCIDASFALDVTYTNDTTFERTSDITWSVDNATTATIDSDGTLHTYSDEVEETTISATYEEVSTTKTVSADPVNLNTIDIRSQDSAITSIALAVGERLQLQSRATLSGDETEYNADLNINWQLTDSTLAGITNSGANNGQLLALKPGITAITANCGGKTATATLTVSGDATLSALTLNQGDTAIADDVESISIDAEESVELSLDANFDGSTTGVNVTEFATWSINGSTLVDAEITSAGTEDARYKLTSTTTTTGEVVITATYNDLSKTIKLLIE
ncbi:Ig-like domain-containing protein [Thalassomonas actiniarum]|uniref:Ig-like domain-containing protein n=1 Tax=Thalassomonas actiniarum TaxID=485447 RepID=A0AAE9YWR1_9GAMM|nr:Ig-like domain-containing protein [Thalassomonas actiniarum]WDE02575.1 Ig-like domain-containing protein [Thalassomonas actiniarum]